MQLCRISASHSGKYEGCDPLNFNVVYLCGIPLMFPRNFLALLLNYETNKKQTRNRRLEWRSACCLLSAGFLLRLLFSPEDGGCTFFRNICGLLWSYALLK